jgi:hypothetical protein
MATLVRVSFFALFSYVAFTFAPEDAVHRWMLSLDRNISIELQHLPFIGR